ncbi:MAG: methyltransferase domain-containing protein [Planctomycetes bacterium]|nr:methyltransferase domain-containing protein [Planctomycetota bacterium]
MTSSCALPTSPNPSPFEAVKARQQQAWSAGDYSVVGGLIVLVAEELCERADIRPGERVLDVATGHGNTALAAARRFARVTGVDYVPALLARARERAAIERLDVDFQDGDAEALPFPDASFDVVTSSFGVMFAPDQARAASELVRVCKPGGRIALASWTPSSPIAEMFRTTGRFLPPPPGLVPPATWGDEAHLRELFGAALRSIESETRAFTFRFASFQHWMEVMGGYYGPVRKAFEALEPVKRAELAAEIERVMRARSRAMDASIVFPSEYLASVIMRV